MFKLPTLEGQAGSMENPFVDRVQPLASLEADKVTLETKSLLEEIRAALELNEAEQCKYSLIGRH